MIQEIRERLKELSDAEVLELLDTVSNEVKRRNGFGTQVKLNKEEIRRGLQAIFEAISKS